MKVSPFRHFLEDLRQVIGGEVFEVCWELGDKFRCSMKSAFVHHPFSQVILMTR